MKATRCRVTPAVHTHRPCPVLVLPRKSIIPPQSTAKDVNAAGSQQSAKNQDSAPFLVFSHPPSGKGERFLMQSTTGCYYIQAHLPSGITNMKCSITRQAGQLLSNATSSIMTYKWRWTALTLTEASILNKESKKWMWTEAGMAFPVTVDCNEQTEAVTPFLRSGGLSSEKFNFWWTHHNSYNCFTRCSWSICVCI